jgi:ketosteroid isomerase-like protein
MSENLHLVRSIYAAWERGDFSSTEWAHPDIEYVHVDGPSPRRWMGLAGLAEGASTWINAWEGFRIEVEDFRELDDERILVLSKGSGRGRASGLDLGQLTRSAADLLHVRDGKVMRFAVYFDRDRALADLGLEEE